jgi:beta-phosphoglucomutase
LFSFIPSILEAYNTAILNIKACIFDFDGVIADTCHFHFQAWKHVAQQLDFKITTEQNELLKGRSRSDAMDQILRWHDLDMTTEDRAYWMERKNERYLALTEFIGPNAILPGLEELLVLLRDIGVILLVGSASRNARTVLEKLKLDHYFQGIFDGNSVKKGKPAPDLFRLAASSCGVNPGNTIVFEDSKAGIEAALKGGFWTIGVGDHTKLAAAHVVIPGFDKLDFHELLLDLSG